MEQGGAIASIRVVITLPVPCFKSAQIKMRLYPLLTIFNRGGGGGELTPLKSIS